MYLQKEEMKNLSIYGGLDPDGPRGKALVGQLTSEPAVSSTRPNRLEVFARGTNRNLYQLTWNGSRWSNWENLGGTITSAPAAVSWGPNRIDVFARGQNQKSNPYVSRKLKSR